MKDSKVNLQEIIDKFYDGGVIDLELKVFLDGHIELGYWQSHPATVLTIVAEVITYCAFGKPKQASDYVNAPKEKQEVIFNNLTWIYELIDKKTSINIDGIEKLEKLVAKFDDLENLNIPKIVEDELIVLGEDGEAFAILRVVFDKLYEQIKKTDPKKVCIDYVCELLVNGYLEYYSGDSVDGCNMQEFYDAIEKPYNSEKFGDEYLHYPKAAKDEGKHYYFRCWYDVKDSKK